MPTINVAIPDKCHLENVSKGEVAALYVEMILRLGREPKIQAIECEDENGMPETTTVIYRHPDSDDVLMQFTVRHDKNGEKSEH